MLIQAAIRHLMKIQNQLPKGDSEQQLEAILSAAISAIEVYADTQVDAEKKQRFKSLVAYRITETLKPQENDESNVIH